MNFDLVQRAIYEAAGTVALGPIWAALLSGFGVVIGDRVFITPAGERYLDFVNSVHGQNQRVEES